MKRLTAFLLLIASLASFAAEPVRVACLGDSITAGIGAGPGMAYPAQLVRMLGDAYDVRNFGHSGATVGRSDKHAIWDTKEYKTALLFHPDIVVIMLGTNDTKPANWAEKKDFPKLYKELVISFQELSSKPKVYVCTPPYVAKKGNFGINEEGVKEQIPMITQIASDCGATLIDVHAALDGKDDLFKDNVHPSSDGATIIAQTVYKGLTGKVQEGSIPSAEPSPFGISASAGSAKNYAEWFPVISAAGVRSVRLFPEWRGLQPAQDKWTWDRTDAMLKSAADNHLQITGLLFGSTPWNKSKSHAFPMDNLDAWSTYTNTLVDRYKNQIHHWEVWNEGNAAFNDAHHTTADYAALVAIAYEAAKKADPTAQIGMSVASFDAPYLNQAILAQAKAGKPNHFDYLCIHPYELLGNLKEADGEIPYLWMSRLLRDALKTDAPEKANAPIWITEVGLPVGKNATERQAAIAAIKAYVMALAQGITTTMWFEARDPTGEEQGFGLINRAGTPRQSYNSFKTMTATLGPSPRYLGWLALGKDAKGYGFVFDGATAPVLVAWMPAAATDNTQIFTADVQMIDPLNNASSTLKSGQFLNLTDTPLFILNPPPDLLAQAKTNAPKPFPWGGDHSTAKTVTLQFGAEPTNTGITQLNRAATAPYQFPDGDTGVRIDHNQNVALYLHPSFANLKTRDYYIRLTLRRLGPGNVGMNLAYEIADNKGQNGPMRNSGGWFSLPDKEGWQTQTWHVTDACFAKMWAYDLSFRPEKSVPFVLGKLEVSTQPFP